MDLVFEPNQSQTAEWIGETIEGSIQLVSKMWGVGSPQGCQIYVMTSWSGFFFQSAPLPWKMLLAISFPFWAPRARRTWPYSAGWTQKFGRSTAIGVKPPDLLEKSDKSIGIHVFVEEKETELKIKHVTCHELTHAWLNEGIATVTVDRFLGKQTIHQETLKNVKSFQPKGAPLTYRELSYKTPEKILHLDQQIAEALHIEKGELWDKIDLVMTEYFEKSMPLEAGMDEITR